ncbi:MAG: hypothetical protein KJO82_08780 [Gammaproteobacteria bacterium]|nr:hypothetical protein [Gammaproteobacteria bacterium]
MKLIASSVVRGQYQDASQGGLYLIDVKPQSVQRSLDWNETEFDWQSRGRETGLRGIAFDGDIFYCMASDELLAFNAKFELVDSWRNSYLKYCRGIAVHERKLFIASSGFDSIIGFDLDSQKFDWALQILTQGFEIGAHPFDPLADDGPLMIGKLDLRDVYCDASGMYMSSETGLIRFSGEKISVAAELPPGSHNARPFRDGLLFNDSLGGRLRYAGRGEGEEDRALAVPHYYDSDIQHRRWCDDELAKAGFARGLCQINDSVVAAGSSPATVSIYNLAANERLLSVRLSNDARTSIHSVAVWPFDSRAG